MEKNKMVEAGVQLIALAEMVDLMKGRGYHQHEIEEISKDNYHKDTLRLASKFLHEIKLARLGKAILLCALLGSQVACLPAIGEMPATGWRVSLGVDPIDGLRDERRLDQVKPSIKQVKY